MSIPHTTFISQLEYNAQMVGIDVVIVEESYTSKYSYLDFEPIGKHETYLGKRLTRRTFRTHDGRTINVDINGSANIIRKAFTDAFANGIQGIVVFPRRVTNKRLSRIYRKR